MISNGIVKAGIVAASVITPGLVQVTTPPTPAPTSPYLEPFLTANWLTEGGYNWQQSNPSDTYVVPGDVTFPMSAYFGTSNNNVTPLALSVTSASDSRLEFNSVVNAATQSIFTWHTDTFTSGYVAQVNNRFGLDSQLIVGDLVAGVLAFITLTGVSKVSGVWLKVIDNGDSTQNLEVRYADAAAPTVWVLATPAIPRPSIILGRPLWAVGVDNAGPAPVAGDIVHANLWRGTDDASLV